MSGQTASDEKITTAVGVSRDVRDEFSRVLSIINGRRAEQRKRKLSLQQAVDVMLSSIASETMQTRLINH